MANERLRDAMLKSGLTPAALAEKLQVNAKTAERWVTLDRPPYPRHRHEIATILGERETYLWPNALSPERAARVAESELVHLYPRRAAVPMDLWRRLIDQAERRVGLLAYAGLFLPEQQPQLIKALKRKAEAGAEVKILLGDPESPVIRSRGDEEGIGDAMASKIHNVLSFYRKLQNVPNVKARYHATPLYNSIYRFDDEMLVNLHAYGCPAAHNPVLHLRRLSGGDLFDTYTDSFQRVWESSKKPIWETPVAG
jgi:transcriptional regulator with XRE-family HTH domain